MIALARPLGAIRNSQNGINLLAGEITYEFLVFPLHRYGENARGDANAVGVPQCDEPKERPNGSEPDIA